MSIGSHLQSSFGTWSWEAGGYLWGERARFDASVDLRVIALDTGWEQTVSSAVTSVLDECRKAWSVKDDYRDLRASYLGEVPDGLTTYWASIPQSDVAWTRTNLYRSAFSQAAENLFLATVEEPWLTRVGRRALKLSFDLVNGLEQDIVPAIFQDHGEYPWAPASCFTPVADAYWHLNFFDALYRADLSRRKWEERSAHLAEDRWDLDLAGDIACEVIARQPDAWSAPPDDPETTPREVRAGPSRRRHTSKAGDDDPEPGTPHGAPPAPAGLRFSGSRRSR